MSIVLYLKSKRERFGACTNMSIPSALPTFARRPVWIENHAKTELWNGGERSRGLNFLRYAVGAIRFKIEA